MQALGNFGVTTMQIAVPLFHERVAAFGVFQWRSNDIDNASGNFDWQNSRRYRKLYRKLRVLCGY